MTLRKLVVEETKFSDLILKHKDFDEAQNILEEVYESRGVFHATIVGPSGSGKSTLAKCLVNRFPREMLRTTTKIPVLYVATPDTPRVSDVCEEILGKMGARKFGKPTVKQMTDQIAMLLKACETRVIIFDEFQHYIDRRGDKSVHAMADWLKNLAEEASVSIVIMGLPRAQLILRLNDQFRRRFSHQYELNGFKCADEEGQIAFCTYLKRLAKAAELEESELCKSEDRFLAIWFASNGLIGYINKLVGRAAVLRLKENASTLKTSHLHRAFLDRIFSKATDDRNPFTNKFDNKPLIYPGEPFAPDPLELTRGRKLCRQTSL